MRTLLVTLLLSINFCANTLAASEPVRLVTVVEPSLPSSKLLADFINELFMRVETPFTLTYRPLRRAEVEFKEGLFDGDAARHTAFSQAYPAAIRVEPAIINLQYFAISNKQHIKQWSDLLPYRVAYIRGSRAVENTLASAKLEPVSHFSPCVAMVKAGRVDFCVVNSGSFRPEELQKIANTMQVQNFSQLGVYIWLAPQQQTLAQKLGRALQHMQKEGRLARFQAAIDQGANAK